MLVSPSANTPNPVVMSRLITTSMLKELEESGGQFASRISVLNVLRLLEMYQHNAFEKRQPPSILESDDSNDINSLQYASAYEQLKSAISLAHHSILPKQTAKQFARTFATMIREFQEADKKKSAADVKKVKTFLTNLTQQLAAAR